MMSSSTDPVQVGSASSHPAPPRRNVDRIRGELVATVAALAAKADVTSQAQATARQVSDKARQVGGQVMGNAPQLIKAAGPAAQRVMQDAPGAAAATALAVVGMVMLRRGRHRRDKARRAQQRRRRSTTRRRWRWGRVLAVVGWLIRRRKRRRTKKP
jgi:hypothetical protein